MDSSYKQLDKVRSLHLVILQENSGLVAGDRNDADIEIDETPHNEWLAAQGLLNLSEDQPKQGNIRKLHEDSKKKKENEHVTETTADDKNDNI